MHTSYSYAPPVDRQVSPMRARTPSVCYSSEGYMNKIYGQQQQGALVPDGECAWMGVPQYSPPPPVVSSKVLKSPVLPLNSRATVGPGLTDSLKTHTLEGLTVPKPIGRVKNMLPTKSQVHDATVHRTHKMQNRYDYYDSLHSGAAYSRVPGLRLPGGEPEEEDEEPPSLTIISRSLSSASPVRSSTSMSIASSRHADMRAPSNSSNSENSSTRSQSRSGTLAPSPTPPTPPADDGQVFR